ncbi:MAG: glycosyltransferase family 9 protein [Simkaniaceae bacterium]|nr:glycosyltransferase family 9 protein [Simkaniaceae bacterium]
MKNWLIQQICHFFPKKKKKEKEQKRVLVVSTTGLGDTLWATPALRALKTQNKDLFLSVLTSPIGFLALKDNPHIDRLFIFKSVAIFPLLKKLHFDTIYIFHASQRIIFPLCHFLSPTRLIGTAGINKGLDSLFTTLHPKLHEHEIHRRLGLIGMKEAPTEMEFSFASHEIPPVPAHSYGIHPGAHDPFKQWDPNYYIELGNWLVKEHGAHLFISGSSHELPLLTRIAQEIPGAKVLTLPLPLFAEHLKQFCCFITNDTGPMHLALALKVPTLALFGPTDPELCGPLNTPFAQVIKVPATCHPCLKQKCHLPFCLEQLSVARVIKEIKKMFPNLTR